ncbi:MAG: thiamine diphosphokinase [Coriobacteriales bacterium]
MSCAVCHIVAAAPVPLEPFDLREGELLIAADGGYAACLEAGLQPDELIGDFDSLEGGAPAHAGCPVTVLPRAKDDTDLMVCVRRALELGARELHLHRALGGDVGHTLAAVKVLMWLRSQGAQGVLSGGGQALLALAPGDGLVDLAAWAPAACQLAGGGLREGVRVSVFSAGGDAHGVVERGLAWELEGATLLSSDHLGVSNEVRAPHPHVGVGEGMLLVVIG